MAIEVLNLAVDPCNKSSIKADSGPESKEILQSSSVPFCLTPSIQLLPATVNTEAGALSRIQQIAVSNRLETLCNC